MQDWAANAYRDGRIDAIRQAASRPDTPSCRGIVRPSWGRDWMPGHELTMVFARCGARMWCRSLNKEFGVKSTPWAARTICSGGWDIHVSRRVHCTRSLIPKRSPTSRCRPPFYQHGEAGDRSTRRPCACLVHGRSTLRPGRNDHRYLGTNPDRASRCGESVTTGSISTPPSSR